jgi:hypothetical protein
MLWVRRDSATAFGNIWVIANAGSTLYEGLYLNSAGTNLRIENNNGGADGATTLTVGTWYHVALVRNGNDRTLYLNGVVDATYNNANSFTSAGEAFAGNGLTVFPGYLSALKQYERALTQDEILQEMRTVLPKSVSNIYNFSPLFRHTELQNYFGAGWTITGTGLTDDGPPVSWGTRPLLVPFASAGPALEIYGLQGNAFQFGQYLASAASGINGTLDTSFANFTVSATGKVEIRGTGANNAIANVTASGLGKVEIEGVGANNTIANVTAAGLGTVLVQGTGANNTIAAVTSTATGTVLVQGTGANNTIGEFTLAGIGSIGAAISGTLDKTIDAVTASATGTVLVQGTGANNTIGAVTASGTGKVEIQGTGANNTIAAVTAAGLGTVRIAGTGANNTIGAFTVSATGSVDIAGTLSSTIGPITVAAIGSVENRGTLDVTVGAVTLAGSGVVGNFVSGQLNQSIGIFSVTATAGVQNTVRSMGATIKQGTFNGSVHAKPYSKSRFRQESMKWPSKG